MCYIGGIETIFVTEIVSQKNMNRHNKYDVYITLFHIRYITIQVLIILNLKLGASIRIITKTDYLSLFFLIY